MELIKEKNSEFQVHRNYIRQTSYNKRTKNKNLLLQREISKTKKEEEQEEEAKYNKVIELIRKVQLTKHLPIDSN